MKINRKPAPVFIERDIEVELEREEIISVLTEYARVKLGSHEVSFGDITVAADASNSRMEKITLVGIEKLYCDWSKLTAVAGDAQEKISDPIRPITT
jgi:hypothetical protein